VAKGQGRQRQSTSPRKRASFFSRPSPALAAATISKMPLKPAAPSRLTAPVSSECQNVDQVSRRRAGTGARTSVTHRNRSRQRPRQRTNTMVEHCFLPPSPPWAGGGEGRSGSKGGEGPPRAAIDVLRAGGSGSCSPRSRGQQRCDAPWEMRPIDFNSDWRPSA